ncbi:acetoacetate decarboxylase family protein [Streptomyces alanosinicus]|uniref:Acetoacetate decarboxylase n=1 Tax=Streptomyces alanosinicus TaxID=68171 RepID=A0A918YJK4_9ACTN|nr:acetoacetate decarboxylase family protein [Streptomyces alanosinicus]GHE06195.1 hypothetical protein GCM10010339_45350 [Streptomyces alanosinicus]
MRADGHAPGRSTPEGRDAGQDVRGLLRRCARDVVDVAEGIRAVSARTSTVLFAPHLFAGARRSPRTGLAAQWALLRALTDRQGLVGAVLGRESLAALVAVTSLRLRIAAVLVDHPEFARDPGMRRLAEAVAGHGLGAVRALRTLLRDQGAQRALSGLTPLMAELPSVRALLDARPPDGGPGDGAAEAVELADQEKQFIATEGSFLGFLRTIEVLSAGGRILVQNVRGPDGVVRYVVQTPGIAPGRPRDDAPHDLAAGAGRGLSEAHPPYLRSVLLALTKHGIPRGADLALIGHGEGGLAMLHLAEDEEFCRTYRVTHVVAVGSRAHDVQPADPHTWIATIANQHDIMPGRDGQDLRDGRAAGSAGDPRPNRYEVDYAGPTREFPLCHLLREYIEHLRTVVPGARADVDEALTPYRGPIVRTQAYRLRDRGRPPEGYPFLTLPTRSVPTTVGPVDVPVRYADSAAAHLCFPVCADTARRLLPDVGWLTPSLLGRRALAVLSLHEHRSTTIGPYTEIALSVLVDDLWRPRRYDIAADLLRRPDLRRTGRYVLSLAVTSEEARVVAREIWGQSAMRTTAEADLTGREIEVRSRDLGLTVAGRLGPGIRCPEADWVLYGRRGGSTVRTLVRAHGRPRLHPGTGVRLRLDTAAAEPLAGQLRRLGMNTARPLFVLACPQFMAHRSAGAVLPR